MAKPIAIDLSQEKATQIVQEAMQQFDLEVDLLINNAASYIYAPFEQSELLKNHQMIMLNVVAMVDLTDAFIPAMLARGTGAILNVGAQGAFSPMPYLSVYAATKAFILWFSEALWVEYRDRGIRVMALCPGATRTPLLIPLRVFSFHSFIHNTRKVKEGYSGSHFGAIQSSPHPAFADANAPLFKLAQRGWG